VFDPYLDYRLYREELARWEQQLERRRMLPRRERHWLARVRFSASGKRRRQRLALRGAR
jgi:hypothetical protein